VSIDSRPSAGELRFITRATLHRMRPKERRRLHTLAVNYARRRTKVASVGLFLLFVVVFAGDLDQFVVDQLGLHPGFEHLIAGLLGGLVGFGVYLLLRSRDRMIRRYLARELWKKGIRTRFCLKCDYDLTGVESNKCPECGALLAALETQVEFEDEDFAPEFEPLNEGAVDDVR